VPHYIYSIATLYCNAMFSLPHCIYIIATLYCTAMFSCASLHIHYCYTGLTAMFSCASLHIHYSYTVLYRHVQLCLTTNTVMLHWTVPPCSAVPHYLYSIATLYCNAIFSCASIHIQYSYTLFYRHVQMCLTTYTV